MDLIYEKNEKLLVHAVELVQSSQGGVHNVHFLSSPK